MRGDAYRTLLRSPGKFDLIVSEPSNPWVTGIEMLYSREFLEAARDSLNPGGVHAQWFHGYESDPEMLALILRTYRSVFDHAVVWYTVGSDLLLIGFQDPEQALDIERLRKRFARPDFKAGFERCKIDAFPVLLAHEILPVDVLGATPLPGELHTLLHPRLSSLAARAFFVGDFGTLPATMTPEAAEIGERNSLRTRLAAAHPGELDEAMRMKIITETCRHGAIQCAPLIARWIVEVPVSPARDKMRSQIRANRELAGVVDIEAVDPLVALFDGAPGAPPAKVTPADATRASNFFIRFYSHAAPFSRTALANLWERCEANPEQRQACVAGRSQVEAIVGDLRG